MKTFKSYLAGILCLTLFVAAAAAQQRIYTFVCPFDGQVLQSTNSFPPRCAKGHAMQLRN